MRFDYRNGERLSGHNPVNNENITWTRSEWTMAIGMLVSTAPLKH